jgi:hypothetical protein
MTPKRMNKIALYLEYIAFVLRDEAKEAERLNERKRRPKKHKKENRKAS